MELSQWDLSILTTACPGPALTAVPVDQCECCTLFMWAYVLEYGSAVRCDRAHHQPVEHPGTCTGLQGNDG